MVKFLVIKDQQTHWDKSIPGTSLWSQETFQSKNRNANIYHHANLTELLIHTQIKIWNTMKHLRVIGLKSTLFTRGYSWDLTSFLVTAK